MFKRLIRKLDWKINQNKNRKKKKKMKSKNFSILWMLVRKVIILNHKGNF